MRTPLVLLLPFAALLPVTAQVRLLATHEQRGVTEQRFTDTDGDGRRELLLLTTDAGGRARLLRIALGDEPTTFAPTGEIVLPDPEHCLIGIADVLPGGGDDIVVCDGSGTSCPSWTGGSEAIVLARRARFALRVDQPRLSPFVADLNDDGRLDLVIPGTDGVQPWLQLAAGEGGTDGESSGAGRPTFRRMPVVPVKIDTDLDTGGTGLDPELSGGIRIAQIETEDLNGDGRPDLLTRSGDVRAFHLQTADGTFAAPIEVDITQFVDSTPKAVVDLGKTAVLGDDQLMRRGDIDGDGIPDHVIAHRRKIWTFLSSKDGPQFQKARTQAVADDVTQMTLIDVDSNGRSDLLTFRVQLPDLGSLLLGLVQSIDIDVRAVLYESEAGGFAPQPKQRRTITLRFPPLLSLIGRQDELIERFTRLIGEAKITGRGDFLGTGKSDLVVVQEGEGGTARFELFADVEQPPQLLTEAGKQLLRRYLFEDENTVFDIDRLFGIATGFLATITDEGTGDREPVARLTLRDAKQWVLVRLEAVELDGRPGDELCATYRAVDDERHRAFDVIAWR